jgi:hypothetical protein
VSDLAIPSGVTLLTPADELILKIDPPRTLEVPVEPVAEAEPAAAAPAAEVESPTAEE